ncbi:hypothetical protein [uncultured Nocardioides sp.]|uniref:hypothetical protein n=1 Tax=uncultured Nocardioides sp. TaxID=198441 RepID=UPI0030FAC8A3
MDLTNAMLYIADLEALGVVIPAETDNARAIYLAAGEAAAQSPADDLRAALIGGQITAENVAEHVRAAALAEAARQTVQTLTRDLHLPLAAAMRRGLEADADRIRADLAVLFKPAAAELTKTAKHFGPGATAQQAIDAGPEAVALFQRIDENTATLNAVARAYQSLLSSITRDLPALGPVVSLYVKGTADLDLEHATQRFNQSDRWLELLAGGFALALNTPEQARRIAREHTQRVEQAERERVANRRQGLRFPAQVGR